MKNVTDIQEIYFSVDIEATGPIPGEYSMSSIGASAAGALMKDGSLRVFDHTTPENTFYAELKPVSDKFVPEAIKVGLLEGFDDTLPDEDGQRRFDWMVEHGQEPAAAMSAFADWVRSVTNSHGGPRPIFMAYPASFDWTFVYWYLTKFDVQSPFGFSGVLDLKTVFATASGKGISRAVKGRMPKSLFPKGLPHTHHAKDDAVEQGVLGMNMLQWAREKTTA